MSAALARRADVKNFFTDEKGDCITGEPSTSTTASKLEHADNTTPIGSSGHQSSWNFGIGPALKSNASNSASFSTRSGREATATELRANYSYQKYILVTSTADSTSSHRKNHGKCRTISKCPPIAYRRHLCRRRHIPRIHCCCFLRLGWNLRVMD